MAKETTPKVKKVAKEKTPKAKKVAVENVIEGSEIEEIVELIDSETKETVEESIEVNNQEVGLIKVFDRKSNRQRFLTQEQIDSESSRYTLR
jgi:hypothetical protein